MEFRFVFRGRVFVIQVGYKTPWSEGLYFLSIIEEFYENREIVFARVIKFLGRRR